jgi:voltage-gated potassium channel
MTPDGVGNMRSLSKVLVVLVVVMASFVLVSAFVFMVAEDLSPVQAFYFAIVTMSTVGYGDIHPKTALGMILSVIMILGGVGIFTGSVALISNAIITKRAKDAAKARDDLLSEIFVREIGIALLERFTAANPQAERLRTKLAIDRSWSDTEFKQARLGLEASDFVVDLGTVDSLEWRAFLKSQSQVFLILLGSPATSESLALTSVLRRTYLLTLALRNPSHETSTDFASGLQEHLEEVYHDLALLWLDYMAHIVREFPYAGGHLESLNPFRRQNR